MAKKPLGLDSMGIQKTMRTSDFIGDGFGQLPLNIISTLVGQLTYFYTEKVGLAAGMVATMLLLAKILDAFTDLIMGKIMDAGKSPKGKCRPWFLRMAAPTAAAIVLLFTVPKGLSSGLAAGYVLITNILASAIVYTAIAIPYTALMAIRTKSQDERGKMGIFRAIFGYAIGMVIAILLIPITNMLGGNQGAWIKVSVVFAVLSLAALLFLYKVTKEQVSDAPEAKDEDANVPFKEGIALLFRNKFWVLMLIANLLMNISYGLSTSGGTYYAKYILGNDNLVGLMGAVGLIPTFLGFALVGPMTKKLGMRMTCMVSCVIGAVACVARAFTPYSFYSCLIGGCFTTFANIPMMCLFGAMVNNCVEYNEWKFGKRLLGMTNSASSFGSKIGSGIGGSLIGWMLAIAGYEATLAVQPTSVNYAIIGFGIYVPLLLFVAIFVLLKMYSLDAQYPQIIADLQARKAGKNN